MFMTKSFFTDFAEVKVLALNTFVSDTDDWIDTATIASDIAMSDKLDLFMLLIIV